MLAVLVINIDLDQDIQRRQRGRTMAGQRGDQLGAVNALHPVKMPGGQVGLVGLQVADQVPFQAQAGQLADLVHRFLHIVFTEGALPLRRQRGDRTGRLGFGHRQQPCRRPAGGRCQLRQLGLDRRQRTEGHVISSFRKEAILPPGDHSFQPTAIQGIQNTWISPNSWRSR